MSKDGVGFAAHGELESYLAERVPTVAGMSWRAMDRDEFIEAAAWSFSALNAAHPFREGNGRSLRLFLDQLSEPAIWWIDYSQVSTREGAQLWDAACHATRMPWPDIDPAPLEELFDRMVEVKDLPAVREAHIMPDVQRQLLGMAKIRPASTAPEVSGVPRQARASQVYYRAVELDAAGPDTS
jgi:cell filamentation protein